MSVRRARPDDWEGVRELRLRALREDAHAFHARYEDEANDPEEEWRDWIRRTAIFVAGDFEGICGAFTRDDGAVQLIAMYVAPEARARGHGRALVAAVEQWANERGAPRVVMWLLPANDAARSLYESCGYGDTGARREEDGGVELARELD
jgi:GNAT superfamily N-acetyltransferase